MRTDRILACSAVALLVLSIVLGGASAPRAGAAGNAFLQALSVILLLFGIWTARHYTLPTGARPLIWIFILFAAGGLLSLVPLPAAIWTALPGREGTAHGFELLGMPPPALPLSLAYQNSIASLLWLLPPAATFLLVLLTSLERRRWLFWTLLVMAAASIVLGAAQLLGGVDSGLRFYQITNRGSPVGFFSNTNHLATLLVCCLPVTGYLAGRSVARARMRSKRFSALMVAGTIGVLLIVGLAIVGSVAGLGLALPSTLAALLIYRRAAYGPLGRSWIAAFTMLAALFIVLAVSGPLSRESLEEEVSTDSESRRSLAANTVVLIGDTFPAGTGLGTFPDVYRTIERPDPGRHEYANHAHNDYVEVVLEAGLVGALAVLAFFIWWFQRGLAAWRSDAAGASAARAGSVIVMLVMLHSIVDYPLRTSAMASVFAMACAMMLAPAIRRQRAARAAADETAATSARHLEAD